MISRTEICSQMKVFDVLLTDEHYYVFGLPVYDNMYVGKHLFPENELYYLISGEIYAKLISLWKCDGQSLTNRCQEYADEALIRPILDGISDCEYIGAMKDFRGSELSVVAQAMVKWMHNKGLT